MSAYLTATKFENVKGGDTVWGFIIGDEYDRDFYNSYTEEEVNVPDLKFLKMVIENTVDHEEIEELFNIMKTNKVGISVNNTWYDWDEIKDLF